MACRNFLVFTMPTEIPECPEALNPLTEWLAPFEPRGEAHREMGVGPDRSSPPLRPEMVSVGPVGKSPIVTYHGTKIPKWGRLVVIRPVPRV